MANSEAGGSGEVLVLVCMKCGREYQYESGEDPPTDLTCEKCGNEVFRRFDDAAAPGEAQQDFRDDTERDLDTDDPEGDATRTDLHELNP